MSRDATMMLTAGVGMASLGSASPPVARPFNFKASTKKQRVPPALPISSQGGSASHYERLPDHAGPSSSQTKKPRAQSMLPTRHDGVYDLDISVGMYESLEAHGVVPPVPTPLSFKAPFRKRVSRVAASPSTPEHDDIHECDVPPRTYAERIAAVSNWASQVEPGSPPPGSGWEDQDMEADRATLVNYEGDSSLRDMDGYNQDHAIGQGRRNRRPTSLSTFSPSHTPQLDQPSPISPLPSKKSMGKLKGFFKAGNGKKATRA